MHWFLFIVVSGYALNSYTIQEIVSKRAIGYIAEFYVVSFISDIDLETIVFKSSSSRPGAEKSLGVLNAATKTSKMREQGREET